MHVLIVMLIQTENLEGVMAFQFAIYFNSHRNYRVNVLHRVDVHVNLAIYLN